VIEKYGYHAMPYYSGDRLIGTALVHVSRPEVVSRCPARSWFAVIVTLHTTALSDTIAFGIRGSECAWFLQRDRCRQRKQKGLCA